MCPKIKDGKHEDAILIPDMHLKEVHVIKSHKLLLKHVKSWGQRRLKIGTKDSPPGLDHNKREGGRVSFKKVGKELAESCSRSVLGPLKVGQEHRSKGVKLFSLIYKIVIIARVLSVTFSSKRVWDIFAGLIIRIQQKSILLALKWFLSSSQKKTEWAWPHTAAFYGPSLNFWLCNFPDGYAWQADSEAIVCFEMNP